MRAGKLNRQITILQPAAGQDAIGQPLQTWVGLATVYANVRHLNGVETIKAGAEASIVKASFRTRRRTDVTAAMRVELGSTTYEIKAVIPDEEDRVYMDLACEVIGG